MSRSMRRAASLLALLAVLMAGLLLLERTKVSVPKENTAQMLDATARTRAAFEAIRAERLRRDLPWDIADDPNGTGMIGYSYSEITTTLGALDAKRSTTNPNVAAMLVDMFSELGLSAGDRVAVNLSGSFPCLNIAVICAMDAMGLRGTIMYSVGASTYGATIPAFTYGDMEHFLYEGGWIQQRSVCVSMGGENDQGLEMPLDTRQAIETRLQGYGYTLLAYEDITENIALRFARYQADGPIACFVNVGGNLASFGPSSGMHNVPGGILTALPTGERGDGLVQRFIADDIPVIQLLNMKGLLPSYGLPIDPVPLPADGEGGVYYTQVYRQGLLWTLLIIGCGGVALIGYSIRNHKGKETRKDG